MNWLYIQIGANLMQPYLDDGYEIVADPQLPLKPWFINWWDHRPVLLCKEVKT